MVDVKPSDLELLWVEPQSDIDGRVPTAQELAANSHLSQQNLLRAQRRERPSGLLNRPAFSSSGKSVTLPLGLHPYAPGHPSLAPLSATTVTLPALADTVSSISRHDHLYLAVMAVEVTADIDPEIELEFQWRAQGSTAIQTVSKENTRRLRSVWAVVHAPGVTTVAAFVDALPLVSGDRIMTVNTAAAGTAIGSLRIYPLDPGLVNGEAYRVVEDTVELIDLLRVWRVQNFNQAGYLWGRTGEANFEAAYHLQPTYRYVGEGWDNWSARLEQTAWRLLTGKSLRRSPTFDRAVQNLINGQVGDNLDAPGTATASPNGSTAIGNDQRIHFTNEPILQRTYAIPVVTADAGGVPQASVPFQVSSPLGAAFSPVATDHRVFAITGQDITNLGILTGLGGTGALVWTAANSNTITVGDTVFVQAAINYPSGSGFAVEGEIERVFRDGVAIAPANVREGIDDLDAYQAPASNENYIVVMGKERAALHYIYRRVTVTSDSSGVLSIPTNERGCFAFIDGVAGRIDRPIVTGLAPSTVYPALVYYPPRSSEAWQFQIRTPRYKGSGEREWINGASVAAAPWAIAHSQGGGNSVFLADGEVQYAAIAFRLPANTSAQAVRNHRLNYRIQFQGEGAMGQTSFRHIELMSSPGLSLPKAGQVLTVENASGSQSRGIAARLLVEGRSLGLLKLPTVCSQRYQVVVFLLLEKEGDRRVLAITLNGGNPAQSSAIALDSDTPHFAGLDTFNLW